MNDSNAYVLSSELRAVFGETVTQFADSDSVEDIIGMFDQALVNTPSVLEIVRCGDCAKFAEYYQSNGVGACLCHGCRVTKNGFCYKGILNQLSGER